MKLLKEENGGVTIILLVFLVALFVVHTVFIDLLRYRMAVSEGESVIRSAGRSALSQFEPELLKYGLFGADGSEQAITGVLDRLTQSQISGNEAEGAFRLYDLSVRAENITGEPLYHLGDHLVFRRQVLERMKYVAGIEFGLEVTQKFARTRQQLELSRRYMQRTQELDALIKEREAKLDEAWSFGKELGQSARAGTSRPLQPMIDALRNVLEDASDLNKEIRDIVNEMKTASQSASETAVPQVKIYSSSYFSRYRSAAGTIASMRAAIDRADEAEKLERAGELREKLEQYASDWLDAKEEEEMERKAENEALFREQNNQKQSASNEIRKGKHKILGACRAMDNRYYDSLEKPGGLFEKYKMYNAHAGSGGMYQPLSTDNPSEFMESSFQLLTVLSDLAEGVRDEVFVNEYALTHFTYRTSEKLQNAPVIQSQIGNREGHLLQEQEAEYILYGLPACQLNIGAAYAEMFAFRTGIRTMESLMKPQAAKAVGTPIVQLLMAVAEGAKKANEDMDTLLNGGAVRLPFLQGVTMNYKDHLRLFYLLHSRDASVLSRMQALIELNTGIDLMSRYTAFRFQFQATQRFWRLSDKQIRSETVVSYD